jgi:hypothetical protein
MQPSQVEVVATRTSGLNFLASPDALNPAAVLAAV